MAVENLPQSVTLRDASGYVGKTSFYVIGNTADADFPHKPFVDAGHILADIEALSNGAIVSAHGPYAQKVAPLVYGAIADYQDIVDKAILVFQDGQGLLHRLEIPAPVKSMFLADQQTVDSGNAAVKQLIADALNATFKGTAPTVGQNNALGTSNGASMVEYVGGFRSRRKLRRRVNIYTKSGNLDEPAE